jgi:serine/threonine protein kinase
MAEMKPPLSDLHPMRAIFQLPNNPPPTLKEQKRFSKVFNAFIARCLQKDPQKRPTASLLLEVFIILFVLDFVFSSLKDDFLIQPKDNTEILSLLTEVAAVITQVGWNSALGIEVYLTLIHLLFLSFFSLFLSQVFS